MAKRLQAIREAHNADSGVTITLDEEEAKRIELATAEVPYLLGHAEGIFGLLYRGMSDGYLSDEPGLISLLEISHRAFKAAAADEGETVAMFDEKLRRVIRHKADAELAQKAASPLAEALQ